MTSFSIIGTGNVAAHLSTALTEKGIKCSGVYGRHIHNAMQLGTQLGCMATDTLNTLPISDFLIFAVTDSAITQLADSITTDAIYIHTSGNIPLEVFRNKANHYGVIYPLQTFSKEREIDFSSVPLFIEASDPTTLYRIEQIAKKISKHVTYLDSYHRQLMHLAAVFACNFTNHCYAIAQEIMKECNLPYDWLVPLTDETAAKLHSIPAIKGQTGPAVRGDEKILKRQAQLLKSHPTWLKIYNIMSNSILTTYYSDNNNTSEDD